MWPTYPTSTRTTSPRASTTTSVPMSTPAPRPPPPAGRPPPHHLRRRPPRRLHQLRPRLRRLWRRPQVPPRPRRRPPPLPPPPQPRGRALWPRPRPPAHGPQDPGLHDRRRRFRPGMGRLLPLRHPARLVGAPLREDAGGHRQPPAQPPGPLPHPRRRCQRRGRRPRRRLPGSQAARPPARLLLRLPGRRRGVLQAARRRAGEAPGALHRPHLLHLLERHGRFRLPGGLLDPRPPPTARRRPPGPQAWMARALLDAHEVSGDSTYLDRAGELARSLIDRFADEDGGGFFDVWEGTDKLRRLAERHK